jgi:hypothetical protein
MSQPTRRSRMTRRSIFGVLAAVAILASFPASAQKAKDKDKDKGKEKAQADFFPFEYGIDIASWYWERQQDSEVTTPPGIPLPVPVSQRVRLPNPQRPETLPVGVYQGAHERMAAIRFDLTERGVTPGSDINKAVLFIEESQDRNEHPSVRPETAKIEACLLTDLLSAGENEQFEDRPAYSEEETDCVDGKREVAVGTTTVAAVWTFDLTKIAEGWGKDPFGNNGVMLLAVLQNTGETWQVNLKLPTKDSTATPENDYELTKNRARLQLDFVAGDEPLIPKVPTTKPAAPTSTGGSTGGSTGTVGAIGPSTDLTGASGGGGFPPVGTDVPADTPALPTTPQAISQPQPTEPRLPGYVWLLIPAGLLALAAVRSVVLEPVGGTRADGVIAAIRRRNAERRGGTLERRTGFLSRTVGTFRRGAAGTRTMFAKLARSVGRKR